MLLYVLECKKREREEREREERDDEKYDNTDKQEDESNTVPQTSRGEFGEEEDDKRIRINKSQSAAKNYFLL